MSVEPTSNFVTKGPLHPEKHSRLYVSRGEDIQAMACISQGKYVALLGARQTGKTSLLYMLRHRLLKQGGVKVAFVDLSGSMGKPEGWYTFVCRRMLDELGINGEPRGELLKDSDPARFDEFLKGVAAQAPDNKIVILLDEIGAIPRSLSESFLWTIRSVFNTRHTSSGEPFAHFVFVLAGSYELQQLTKGKGTVSPFNICEKIYMTDWPLEGVQQMVQILGESGFDVGPGVDAHMYKHTGGHPYLTQRICSYLQALGPETPITPDAVDSAVAVMLEGDDCLTETIDRLKDNDEIELLARRILLGGQVRFDRNQQDIVVLELTGAIKRDSKGHCVMRNRICEVALRHYFNIEDSATVGGPRQRKARASWHLRVIAVTVAALVFGAAYFLSRSWSKAVLSIPLLWLISSLVFYLKDIKFKDNTSDPDRVLMFEGVAVQSVYNPVIKANQEHIVLVEVLHMSPRVYRDVTVTLVPMSQNLGVKSEFSHTYTEDQESKVFTLVLGRRATLWALLFPFAEQLFVEFSAEAGTEKRSGLLKLNADNTFPLVISAVVSLASLAAWLVGLASDIKDLLKP